MVPWYAFRYKTDSIDGTFVFLIWLIYLRHKVLKKFLSIFYRFFNKTLNDLIYDDSPVCCLYFCLKSESIYSNESPPNEINLHGRGLNFFISWNFLFKFILTIEFNEYKNQK